MVPLHECPCLLMIVSIDSNSLMNPYRNYRPAAVDEIPAGWPRSHRPCAEWRVTMRPSLFTRLRLDTLGRDMTRYGSVPASANGGPTGRDLATTPPAARSSALRLGCCDRGISLLRADHSEPGPRYCRGML